MEKLVQAVESNKQMFRTHLTFVDYKCHYTVDLHVHSLEQKIRRGEEVPGVEAIIKKVLQEQDEITQARL